MRIFTALKGWNVILITVSILMMHARVLVAVTSPVTPSTAAMVTLPAQEQGSTTAHAQSGTTTAPATADITMQEPSSWLSRLGTNAIAAIVITASVAPACILWMYQKLTQHAHGREKAELIGME
mmetsp:Transcript_6608/g.16195  ORF Transcript_6608/g.16195 Transcript_6608/m.16195 type:complete len:124 (+) Transcript_6608:112-483(+)